ncbi:MAG: hypothetical protein P4M00_25610 [Azospirillaceae bacterium]|nr:hypothetical protein [Azospirillaceae bacterium]
MARKDMVSLETLAMLGVEKLTRIVLGEAEDNPAFRKRVVAALASVKGPDAVAALIGLEKEAAFAEDLGATVATITQELARLSPLHAVQRLLRLVDTHAVVFRRIDDSAGRIRDVYWQAVASVSPLIAALPPLERARRPARLQMRLRHDTHGLAQAIADARGDLDLYLALEVQRSPWR